ncbi:MAG: DNA primase, partial [Desulfocucumaceae bacterium]
EGQDLFQGESAVALIPPGIIEDVRIQTDIVGLISEYVRLEKRGRNYTGACPFHQERDPSFTVSPDKQIFYCFGCQAGGNVIKFLMMIESLTFVESVRRLANRAGIYFPDIDKGGYDKRAAREERAWKANGQARDFYHSYLLNSPEGSTAREYLAERGLSADIIKTFKIGYAPAAWDALATYMKGHGYGPEELMDFGLVAGDRGKSFDRFRKRVLFPVTNPQGNVVAFGGRILGPSDDQPKYLNTPETPFFNKSKVLFGLELARQSIRTAGYAVIMEGYMDVVAAHQFGISNTLASMGTSLTAEQGKLLIRYTRDVYIAYDADAAGMKAAVRGLDILQQVGCRLRVISMPGGTDPDDFIRENGVEGWNKIISGSETLLEYKIRMARKERTEVSDILGEVLPNLTQIKSEIELEEGVKLVASRLGLSWEAVWGEIKRYKEKQRKTWVKPDKIAKNTHNIIKSAKPGDALSRAEAGILKIIVEKPEKLGIFRKALGDDYMEDPLNGDLYRAVARQIDAGTFSPADLMNDLEERAAHLLGRLIVDKAEGPGDTEKIIDDYINVIIKSRQARKRMNLMQELADAEKNKDIEHVNQILKMLQEIGL